MSHKGTKGKKKMKQMFLQTISAIATSVRLLLKSRRTMGLMFAAYAGLLTAGYLFVSTREATVAQLVLTMTLAIVVPALFFLLQAASVSYTDGALSRSLFKNCLRLTIVSVPVIGITVLAVYGLSKVHSLVTLTTAARYLLIGVFAPLLAIQLWVAFSGNRPSLRKVVAKAFAPQSLVVYVCGFLIFAVAPYVLITLKISTERAWLEFSFLMLRLSASALLILLGWVTTVGAISILSRSNEN
jgi:hypothetical protein